MNKKVCEIIPCKSFNERIKLTEEFLKKGIIPQVLELENCLFVDYTIPRKRVCGKRRRRNGTN